MKQFLIVVGLIMAGMAKSAIIRAQTCPSFTLTAL
jgi:hypothetical protein